MLFAARLFGPLWCSLRYNFSFFILPALAPHKSDSIIPNIAILNAGIIRFVIAVKFKLFNDKRALGNNVDGILPTSATLNLNTKLIIKAIIIPANEAGNIFPHFLGHKIIIAITSIPKNSASKFTLKPYIR